MKVSKVMLPMDKFCCVRKDELFKVAIEKMDSFKIGIICVMDGNNLSGVITDGDIRRKLLNSQKPLPAIFVENVSDNSIKDPVSCHQDDEVSDLINLIEEKKIWDIPVINDNRELVGLFHLHSALKYKMKNE